MKRLRIFILIFLLPLISNATEHLFYLEDKVHWSDLIVIGYVRNVREEVYKTNHRKTGDVVIDFEIEEALMGKERGEIVIKAFSHPNRIPAFSPSLVMEEQKYIVYVKQKDNSFHLAWNSNQALEHICKCNKYVQDE